MEYKIKDILEELRITNFEIKGENNSSFSKTSTVWDAEYGAIVFCTKDKVSDPVTIIERSKASVVIVDKSLELKMANFKGKSVIIVDNAREIYLKIINKCFPAKQIKSGIHPSAIVDAEAEIHKSTYIGAKCVIGKCKIGENTIIHANVVINDSVVIGKNVIISPGCVIGFDGFGYYRDENGNLQNFPHFGGVIIEDDVEIGSNTSIDRGTLGNTIIKKGAKVDNLIHVAHNVVIGKNSMVIAHAMLGGSAIIGESAWVAPGAILRDGIKIGNKALVGLGAVVTKDVPDNTIVVGNPAKPFEKKPKK